MPYARLEPLERRRLLAAILDDAYGEHGLVPGGDAVWQVIGRRTNGSVLFGVDYGGGQQVEAIRPDGTFDPTFSGSSDYYNFAGSDFTLDARDRIIYLGTPLAEYDDEQRPLVQRYRADGELDPTFTPTALPRPGPYKNAPVVYFSAGNPKLDSQGRTLVSSYAEFSKTGDFLHTDYARGYLERINPNGGRDTSFGDGGRMVVTLADFELTPDDKIVALNGGPDAPATLTRYTTAGRPDASFGGDGTVSLPNDMVLSTSQMAIDVHGRIVIAYARAGQPTRVFVRRFTASGEPDTTFGTNGLSTLTDAAFDGTHGVSYVGFDPNGRIVGGANQGLFRLTAAGAIDTDFAANGVIATGQEYLFYTLPTPEGIYTAVKIGDTYGIGRYVEPNATYLDPETGTLTITGTADRDLVRVRPRDGKIGVRIGSAAERLFAGVKAVQINALGGKDAVTVSATVPTGVSLGAGNDLFTGTGAAFTVFGGAGDDTITTGDPGSRIDAGDDSDRVTAGPDADTIESGAGDDTVFAGNGRDDVTNAAGADTIDLGPGGGTFVYGNRDEYDIAPQTVTALGGRSTHYRVLTGQGADVIAIVGGDIVVNAGSMTRDGTHGNGNRVTALAAVRAEVSMADTRPRIVTGPGDDRITVYGPQTGGRGRVSAGAGNDTILTADGRDTINAGPGDDVVIDAGGANLIYGGDGRDSLRTGAGDDTLYGDAGQDTLRSGSGNDRLDGGAAGDLLFSSSGRDTVVGGSGRDRAGRDDDDEIDGVESLI